MSFESGETKLKVKPKAPKSGKPGKGAEMPKPDFCKLVTTDNNLGASFIFEKTDFKDALVNHTFFIEEMVVPEELKSEKDFSKVREMARRKGRIVRKTIIDEVESEKTIEFEA